MKILIMIAISGYFTYQNYGKMGIEIVILVAMFTVALAIPIVLITNQYKFNPEDGQNATYFKAKNSKIKIKRLKGDIYVLMLGWVFPMFYKPLEMVTLFVGAMIIISSITVITNGITDSIEYYDKLVERKNEEQRIKNLMSM